MPRTKPYVDPYITRLVGQNCIDISIFENKIDRAVSSALLEIGYGFDSYKEKRFFYLMNLHVVITRYEGDGYHYKVYCHNKLIYQQ